MIIAATHKGYYNSTEHSGACQATTFAEDHPLRILIVEDNIINQKLIERILHKLGYHTETASDGIQVLSSIAKKEYNVILMDIRMPEMDGLEATREIRQMAIKQPYIIAMTANAMSNDREECLDNGMNDYLAKPLSTDEIINSLKKGSAHICTKNT